MSLPEFATGTTLSREDAINQIISSIAMEELGISHIINAEGEKLQFVLGTIPGLTGPAATIEDVLKVNESVRAVLQSAAESQSLLRNKLQNALASAVLTGPTGPIGSTGATGPATIGVGDVTGLDPGEDPTVVGTWSEQHLTLDFGIPRGEPGAVGAAGADGTDGAVGATGPTGLAELAAYGTFVSTGTQNHTTGTSVALNAPLGTVLGMTHTAGDATVSVTGPGVYRIDYRVSTTTGTDTDAVISLVRNTQIVPNSGIVTGEAIGEVSGVAIITLAANDSIAIGTSASAVNLPAGTSAFLEIIRIA